MRALVYSQFTTPEHYEVADVPKPDISSPNDVLIKVVAASINPVDVKVASGTAKAVLGTPKFPVVLGYDVSGTVSAVGSAVTKFKVGDEVYTRLPEETRGSVAEYAVTPDQYVSLKPKNLTHTEAASIPLAALTTLQSFDVAEGELQGGLQGKTVLVPAALSGTGSIGLQLAKNVFGASKVITTTSTSKIPKVAALLGDGVVDQIIDYTVADPWTEIPKKSVDFLFDIMGEPLSFLPVMKSPSKAVSIATIPPGSSIVKHVPELPFYIRYPLDLIDYYLRLRSRWSGVSYEHLFLNPSGKDLARLATWIEEGKLKPVVGRVEKLSNLKGVREGCAEVFSGKGGIGKFVIEIE